MAPPVAVAQDPIAAEMVRIQALRATLVIHHPFWASLLLPMHIDAVYGLPTFAVTDCVKHIWINPEWTRHLNLRQLGYVIIHEAGHVAFLHGLRKVFRDHDKWNIACTLPGAMVLGANAVIEDVEAGAPVYHHDGLGTVTQPMARMYRGKVYTIKASGLLPFSLTPEHPVRICHRTEKNPHPIRLKEPRWISTGELHERDYVLVPRLKGVYSLTTLPLDAYIRGGYTDAIGRHIRQQNHLAKPLKHGFPLTKDTAWFMGLYVAEGSRASRQFSIQFSLGPKENQLVARVQRIAKDLGYRTRIDVRPSSSHVVTIPSTILNRAFSEWFGTRAAQKRIPHFILLHQDLAILKAFVQGLVDGDGCVYQSRGTIYVGTASKLLALQLQLALARLGLLASVCERHRPERDLKGATLPPQIIYEIVWRPWRTHKKILNPQFGKPVTSHNLRWKVFPDFIATPITKITTRFYAGPVYNLETSAHTYLLSNATVHNCDLAINDMLQQMVDANGKPLYDRPDIDIPGFGRFSPLYEEWAKGLTAEEIYDRLPEQHATRCPLCGDPHTDNTSKGAGQGAGKSGKPGQQAPQNGAGSGDGQSQAGHQNPTAPQSGSSGAVPSQPQNETGGGCPAYPWAHGHCQPGQTCLQIPETLTEEQAQDLIDHVQAAYESWIASHQRGTMPGSLNRFIQKLRAAKVPWQRVLHQYAGTALAKDDYSLSPPHRRLLHHDIIRPSLRSETIALLVLVFDTSGSISRPMAEEFAAEGAKLHTLCEETLILTGDCTVQQVIRTQQVPEFLRKLEFKGGGGTSHIPIFTWLEEHRLTPDLLVACTDLFSEYPDRKPPFAVLWCTKEGHGAGPPWGRIVIIPEKTS